MNQLRAAILLKVRISPLPVGRTSGLSEPSPLTRPRMRARTLMMKVTADDRVQLRPRAPAWHPLAYIMALRALKEAHRGGSPSGQPTR